MKVAVLQSNYIPWKGYFDLMDTADVFVVYDSSQYTKNDWRNRNQLTGPNGLSWLTIPVNTRGHLGQKISDATVIDSRWARKHWATVKQSLTSRLFFKNYETEWEDSYLEASKLVKLHDINLLFLRSIAISLNIQTQIICDDALPQFLGSPSERLVQICTQFEADEYITGPAALNYLDVRLFAESKIKVNVISYDSYPIYSQGGKDFNHFVSVLDLLANVGPESSSHLLNRFT